MVPHATADFERRRSSGNRQPPTPTKYKFPDFVSEHATFDEDEDISRGPSPQPLPNGLPTGLHSSERWPAAKRSSWTSWGDNGSFVSGKTRHGRQKSLTEAIRTVRTKGRSASISENAHEIAESLKAPISFKLVVRLSIYISPRSSGQS